MDALERGDEIVLPRQRRIARVVNPEGDAIAYAGLLRMRRARSMEAVSRS